MMSNVAGCRSFFPGSIPTLWGAPNRINAPPPFNPPHTASGASPTPPISTAPATTPQHAMPSPASVSGATARCMPNKKDWSFWAINREGWLLHSVSIVSQLMMSGGTLCVSLGATAAIHGVLIWAQVYLGACLGLWLLALGMRQLFSNKLLDTWQAKILGKLENIQGPTTPDIHNRNEGVFLWARANRMNCTAEYVGMCDRLVDRGFSIVFSLATLYQMMTPLSVVLVAGTFISLLVCVYFNCKSRQKNVQEIKATMGDETERLAKNLNQIEQDLDRILKNKTENFENFLMMAVAVLPYSAAVFSSAFLGIQAIQETFRYLPSSIYLIRQLSLLAEILCTYGKCAPGFELVVDNII